MLSFRSALAGVWTLIVRPPDGGYPSLKNYLGPLAASVRSPLWIERPFRSLSQTRWIALLKHMKSEGSYGDVLLNHQLTKFESLIEAVSNLSPLHNYPMSVEIYKQGSRANEVYLIENGTVKMTRTSHEGQQVIVSLRSTGRFIGASSVILQKPFSVNAVTLTSCDLRRIEGGSFVALLKSDAQLCWQFQEMLCHEIYEQVDHTAELGSLSARSRLELFLWNSIHSTQSSPPPTNIKVQLPLKNKELADLIAVTPEHLSRMLRRMQDEDLVRIEKGWIVVADLYRLWHPPTVAD